MSVTVQYTKAHRLVLSGIKCDCGQEHRPITQDIYLAEGLLRHLPTILRRREVEGRALLVADENTYRAAGSQAQAVLNAAQIPVTSVVMKRQGPLRLDEGALGELLMDMPLDTQWFLGVGGGTVTGLCRLAAAVTERPYVCLPTAPSTDSYPLGFGDVWRRGELARLRLNTPELVVCDLDLIGAAPERLKCAGWGRMLSAFLARVDHLAGHVLAGKPLCPRCAAIPGEAAQRLLDAAEDLDAGDPALVKALMEALLVAGLAQDICFSHRPMASSAQAVARTWQAGLAGQGMPLAPDGVAQGVAALTLWPRYLAFARKAPQDGPLKAHFPLLRGAVGQLPDLEKVQALFGKLGCPTRPQQLGLDPRQAQDQLEQALKACEPRFLV